jgi:PAS domain S-box-containing protein
MAQRNRSLGNRYAVTLCVTTLTLVLTLFVEPFRDHNPFLIPIIAITLSVWYGGFGPGLASTILAAVTITYFASPSLSTSPEDRLRLGVFILACLLINALHEVLHRKHTEARQFTQELERQVAERTAELEGKTASLRESELRFRSVAESANDGIIVADHEARILSWNKAAETIFGYREEEVLGKPVTVLMPERYIETHEKGLQRLQRTGESHVLGRTLELHGRRKDGSEFPLELSLSRWTMGTSEYYSGIARDITARKQVEGALKRQAQELARSNADLERFAYVASHDLQEPLRMVASYVELLGRRYKGKLDPDADEFISFAVDGAHRMQQLIHDLLRYARLGAEPSQFTRTDSNAALNKALTNLEGTILEAHAHVTSDPLPTILGNHSQLVQLFQNLIGNALKFHGPLAPRIHVSAELRVASVPQQREWLFSVRDNGIGIDPQHTERIFEIFERLHDQGTYSGTGIGLAICKRIVEGHGGRIWVKSQPGQGSTFYFTIPEILEA